MDGVESHHGLRMAVYVCIHMDVRRKNWRVHKQPGGKGTDRDRKKIWSHGVMSTATACCQHENRVGMR